MKRTLLSLLALAGCCAVAQAQTVISKWTFETSYQTITNSPAATTLFTGIAPEVGLGLALGSHATAAVFSSPSGNGSPRSFSANTWAVGDYWQFQVSTVGFTGVGIAYDQTSSGTGPGRFDLSYSTDGTTFTPIATGYTVLANSAPNAWNTTVATAATSFIYDLSGVTALDNAANVYFRLTDSSTISANGGTVASGGTDRVDNFVVFSPVPEPSVMALAALGGLMGLVALRRKA